MSKQQGITIKKDENFSDWYSEVCFKCDLVDLRYNVQGFVVHKPWGMKIIKNIYSLFENELEKNNHEPVLFPTVIPEKNFLKEAEHVEGFSPEVFWLTQAGDKKLEEKLALRPTSETAMYQMYSLWIRSHKDLPLKNYQSVSVFRNETNTRPFLRGREFLWIEAHDAFATQEEMIEQVKEDIKTSTKILEEKLGISIMTFKRPQWDKFAGAVDTYASDVLMPDGKVNQIGSTHNLGNNFAKPFNVKFTDKDEQEKFVWQTSYGPGIWRIMASLMSVHGDDNGLILPFEVSPIQVVIIPIKDSVLEKCKELKEKLETKDYRVKIDTRKETPGWKFNYWEMQGVPVRLEIGPREVEEGKLTISRRDLKEKEIISEEELIKKIKSLSKEILENLQKKSKYFLQSNIYEVYSRKQIIDIIKKGGYAKINFCGKEECANDMQMITQGGKVRGKLAFKEEISEGTCAWCGAPAKEIVYVAKQY